MKMERELPLIRVIARQNRLFLGRVVGYLAEAGIRQFIDPQTFTVVPHRG